MHHMNAVNPHIPSRRRINSTSILHRTRLCIFLLFLLFLFVMLITLNFHLSKGKYNMYQDALLQQQQQKEGSNDEKQSTPLQRAAHGEEDLGQAELKNRKLRSKSKKKSSIVDHSTTSKKGIRTIHYNGDVNTLWPNNADSTSALWVFIPCVDEPPKKRSNLHRGFLSKSGATTEEEEISSDAELSDPDDDGDNSKGAAAEPHHEFKNLHLLLQLALQMDFQVLLCDERHRDASSTPDEEQMEEEEKGRRNGGKDNDGDNDDDDASIPHPRLHYLPTMYISRLKSTAFGPGHTPRFGFLLIMQEIVEHLSFRHLLLLSPNILLGVDILGMQRRLTAFFSHRNVEDPFDNRVFVPRVLLLQTDDRRDDDDDVSGGENEEQWSHREAQLPMFSHGFKAVQAVGSRITLYPYLCGMHALEQRGKNLTSTQEIREGGHRVDAAGALMALLPYQALKERLELLFQQLAEVWPEAGGDDGTTVNHRIGQRRGEKKSSRNFFHQNSDGRGGEDERPDWMNRLSVPRRSLNFDHYTKTLPLEVQYDLSIAWLSFPKVMAVPDVTVTYAVSRSSGHRYISKWKNIAAVKIEIAHRLNTNMYADLNAVLPSEISTHFPLRVMAEDRKPHPLRYRPLTLYWDAYCSCTGINIEAINFLVALETQMKVRAVAAKDCWCHGFPCADVASLSRLRKPKRGSGIDNFQSFDDKKYLRSGGKHQDQKGQGSLSSSSSSHADYFDMTDKTIWVSHKPVDAFPNFPYHGVIDFPERPHYVIGRTMIEQDRISADWVRRINQADDKSDGVNEIWVPSKFLLNVFYDSGVREDKKISVIPEPIDVYYYDPKAITLTREELFDQYILKTAGGRNRNKNINKNPEESFCQKNLNQCYHFFSNFKWEWRKGWDILLRAYFSEFTRADKVILYIKTYLYLDPTPRDVEKIKQKILRFATEKLKIKDVNQLPQFVILTEETDAKEMPFFYKAMDCFVLPTRGEGWGLPMQEAMSLGLPTIATNWGGNIDFMTEGNSFLIPIDGMEPIHHAQGALDAFFGGRGEEEVTGGRKSSNEPRQAKPNLKKLRQLMRFVFTHQDQAKKVGELGRQHIVENFSREAVAKIVIRRISEIYSNL